MKVPLRAWIGMALLSTSWLLGLRFYHAPLPLYWIVTILAAVALLRGTLPNLPARPTTLIAALFIAPALAIAPWPYAIAPLLLVLGLVLGFLPLPLSWPKPVACGAITAGAILTLQTPVLLFFEYRTARSHDLPRFLAQLLALVAKALNIDATLAVQNGAADIALGSMRKVHLLGATWELLLDPVTLCFIVLVPVILLLQRRTLSEFCRRVGAFLLAILAWLPLRAGLLMGLFMHRNLVTDYEAPLELMNQFYDPWLHLILLLPPVLLAWRFAGGQVEATTSGSPDPRPASWRSIFWIAAFTGAGLAASTAAIFWIPSGDHKEGRVLVDEGHKGPTPEDPQGLLPWEPTLIPFDTTRYGYLTSYTYATMYAYCSHFYDMGRIQTPITDFILANCDVLMIKIPTARYDPCEIDAIERFVRRGGGLLLIGEHTDVYGSSTYLNDIAERFGFSYRFDAAYDIDTGFQQHSPQPLVPHPVLQHRGDMDFAVSCTIDPGNSAGRAVIESTGLRNMYPDYHSSNFLGLVEERPESRYGAFIQLWAVRHGSGQVLAFTDSTDWSNFCAFEPGKMELMMGMIEVLNRHQGWNPRPWLLILSVALILAGLIVARRRPDGWLLILAAGLFGWTLAICATRCAHAAQLPEPAPIRPLVNVLIDRTTSRAILPNAGFISGSPEGFGIFERWILRVGYFTSRREGTNALHGNLLVAFYPTLTPSADYLAALRRYVESGGHLLVLDSPQNKTSTANSLLVPFNMAFDHAMPLPAGKVSSSLGFPEIPVDGALVISGGEPFAAIDGKAAAARAHWGQGTVTALGFASRFSDQNMGVTGDADLTPELRPVYDYQFRLLRWIVEGTSPAKPSAFPPDKPPH